MAKPPSHETELRAAAEAAYKLARQVVYDLGLREDDVGLTARQREVLEAFRAAELALASYRVQRAEEPPSSDGTTGRGDRI